MKFLYPNKPSKIKITKIANTATLKVKGLHPITAKVMFSVVKSDDLSVANILPTNTQIYSRYHQFKRSILFLLIILLLISISNKYPNL